MAQGKFIAYYRVSTDRQGRSGLGLDAQRKSVEDYLNGGTWELVASFTEVESGKRDDRPELLKALDACRRHRATLIIAKLDRLARNTRFLLTMVERSGENGVVFCDLPNIPPGPTGKFLITQMAAVAELERGLISQRTKAALQAAKARGKALGWSIPARRAEQVEAARKGVLTSKAQADRYAGNVLPIVESIRASGVTTLAGIAQALNARGIRTARGRTWYPMTVKNLIARTAPAASPRAAAE